jgi:thiosulfate dehydrogenase [quinone] large subunit
MADVAGTDKVTSPPSGADLSLAALILFGVRFVQGFIFWGGATRRLIYDSTDIAGVDYATKLDFDHAGFVGAKLMHALPGVLWVGAPIEWTLRHHDVIVTSVWLWTIVELAVGLGLMLGFMTRANAFVAIGLNIVLMIVFGWMGSTCLDEWTMAVCGVAMSAAVFLSGSGAYSLDSRFIIGSPFARNHAWAPWVFSGPLPEAMMRKLALRLGFAASVFTVVTYQILHGAVLTPLHARTNFHHHNIALSALSVAADGSPTFEAYVNAGPDTGAAFIVAATLLDGSGQKLAEWDGKALAAMPIEAIRNQFSYAWASHFQTERLGFSGTTGARAKITLPAPTAIQPSESTSRVLLLEAIDGTTWHAIAGK